MRSRRLEAGRAHRARLAGGRRPRSPRASWGGTEADARAEVGLSGRGPAQRGLRASHVRTADDTWPDSDRARRGSLANRAGRRTAAVARGRARPRALEPPCSPRSCATPSRSRRSPAPTQKPHLPGFTRPSPFAALPHAMHADPVRLARFWRHELGVGDGGPLPDLVPLVEAAGVDVVHARLDADTPHGACALVAAPWAGGAGAGRADRSAARARTVRRPRRPPSVPSSSSTASGDRSRCSASPWPTSSPTWRWATARPTTSASTGRDAAAARPTPTPSPRSSSRRCPPCGAGSRWTARRRARALSRATPPPRPPHPPRPPTPPPVRCHLRQLDLVVRLANHFGVSFWVARYRAKAAGILSGPTHLRAARPAAPRPRGRS